MTVTVNLFWVILICAIVILFYFVKECFFKDKDTSITTNIIDKFPLVSPNFINKSVKMQNVENNQEIHELNKRIEYLEKYIEALNNKIEKQLDTILRELGKRG
jgi:peptidoglycan hydrolase CwlO-like protein